MCKCRTGSEQSNVAFPNYFQRLRAYIVFISLWLILSITLINSDKCILYTKLANNSLYLGNNARQSHSYYGTLIIYCIRYIALHYLWWLSVISEAHFSDILLRIKLPFINTKGCHRFPIFTFYSYLEMHHRKTTKHSMIQDSNPLMSNSQLIVPELISYTATEALLLLCGTAWLWHCKWRHFVLKRLQSFTSSRHSTLLAELSCTVKIYLTLWRPLLPYGYSYKASCTRPG